MLKDTKSLGNNKAPACESRGFVLKKEGVLFDTPSLFGGNCRLEIPICFIVAAFYLIFDYIGQITEEVQFGFLFKFVDAE